MSLFGIALAIGFWVIISVCTTTAFIYVIRERTDITIDLFIALIIIGIIPIIGQLLFLCVCINWNKVIFKKDN